MKTLRVFLHGFVLTLINIGSILVGFGIYHLLKPVSQIAVQAPSAAILCIIAFLLWGLLVRRLSAGNLSLRGRGEFARTFLLALLWSPTIFIPLHYIGRGYLTSFGNIRAMWLFQIPTNFLALGVVKRWVRAEEG